MMIGIDLGTTLSVIAVPGKVSPVPGYPEARYHKAVLWELGLWEWS